jgi:hypothetical protein
MLFRLLIAAACAACASAALAGSAVRSEAAPESPDVERLIDRAVGLPSLPAAPPANLAAPEPARPASALAVEVSGPAGLAAGKTPPPGTAQALRVTLANRGTSPLSRITVVVQADGARIEPAGGWRIEGGLARAEIAALAPGGRGVLPLTVRPAEVPPGGEVTVRVLVDARVADQPPAAGELAWTVRDCPGAYRAALLKVRTGPLAETRQALQALRRGDAALPQGLRFMPPPATFRGAAGEPLRLAAAIADKRGGDPELSRSPLDYTAERTLLELDQYMNQRAVPTLCTGASVVVSAYRRAFTPVENRMALIRLMAGRARPATGAEGAGGDDLATRVRRAVEEAKLLAPEAPEPGSPLAILTAARAAMAPGTRLEPAAAEALAAVEVEAWLTHAEAGADQVSRAFAATLDGVLAAHHAACTCAP